jgi:hypothetical protein
MEVLIAMFVTMIGLLGVAAMIPLGHHQIVEGAKADAAATLGRAAYRSFKVRGTLSPTNWCDILGDAIVVPDPSRNGWPGYKLGNGISPLMHAVIFDPLGVANNFGPWFPAEASPPGQPGLPRITFGPGTSADAAKTRAALAEEMFRGSDDLLLNYPEDGDLPSQQLFSPTNNGALRMSEGDFSFMVTLVPRRSRFDDPISDEFKNSLGNVSVMVTASVVVFYQRDLRNTDERGEHYVAVNSMPGGGVGGGDIVLAARDTKGDAFELRPGQWIMLAGGPVLRPNLGPPQFTDYGWYRVAAVEVTDETDIEMNVTLAGPDWKWNPANANTPVNAWVIDGVIGVYERHVRLEGQTPWRN